ncbi:hypothetical protein N7486_007148 [Penicillium sp. IBT 16267x]|nr:hypothetical protein N7486_007148 [Penicillium sp. IBT 16267x]
MLQFPASHFNSKVFVRTIHERLDRKLAVLGMLNGLHGCFEHCNQVTHILSSLGDSRVLCRRTLATNCFTSLVKGRKEGLRLNDIGSCRPENVHSIEVKVDIVEQVRLMERREVILGTGGIIIRSVGIGGIIIRGLNIEEVFEVIIRNMTDSRGDKRKFGHGESHGHVGGHFGGTVDREKARNVFVRHDEQEIGVKTYKKDNADAKITGNAREKNNARQTAKKTQRKEV